jgi:hypothetical protein
MEDRRMRALGMLKPAYSLGRALRAGLGAGRRGGSQMRRTARLAPRIDFLECRVALSTYLWTALGDATTWDDPQNWQHVDRMSGMRMTGVPTAFSDVVFPPLATLPAGRSAAINFNDPFLYLPLDSLSINDSYTFSGNPLQVNQLLSVSNPFTRAPGGTSATLLLAGLRLAPGATIDTGTGSTLTLGTTTAPTGLQLTLQGGLNKTGSGRLVVNTQSFFFPTTPTQLPVPVVVGGGSFTLGDSVNLNAINFQVDSTASLIIADNVAARVRSLTGTGLVTLNGTTNAGDTTSLTLLVPAAASDRFDGFVNGIGDFAMGGFGTLTTGTINFGGAGSIVAASGTLDVEGSISASTLQVMDNATFGGLGIWAFSGAAVFQPGSTFLVTLNGTAAGSQYTQLVSTSSVSGVNLGNSNLAAAIGLAYEQTDQFTIVSAPIIQNSFQNVVAGRVVLDGVPFGVTSLATSVKISPLQSVTTTQLASSGSPSNPGVPVTFSASVSTRTAPVTTGSVSFLQDGTVVATVSVNSAGTATFTTTSLPVGSTALAAVYNGNGGFLGSTSPTVVQTVVPFSTVTSLVSSGNPSIVGQPVTLTASVSAGAAPATAGTVTFRRGRVFLGTVAVGADGAARLAVSSLPAGTVRIQAVYNGTTNFTSSVSPVLKQKVNPHPTTTILSLIAEVLPNNRVRFVLEATVTANGDSSLVPAGTVVFRRNGVAIGKSRLTSGSARLVLGRRISRNGRFVAVFLGSARFRRSSSAAVSSGAPTGGVMAS